MNMNKSLDRLNFSAASVFLAALCLAAPAAAEVTTFRLDMSGEQEVPNPGDPDGQASGTLSIDDATGEVSWQIEYSGIAPPAAMHIHTGAAGSAGGVVVPLNVETSGGEGTLVGSTTAEPSALAPILSAPQDFYVNIHNADHRAGALRGQLTP